VENASPAAAPPIAYADLAPGCINAAFSKAERLDRLDAADDAPAPQCSPRF